MKIFSTAKKAFTYEKRKTYNYFKFNSHIFHSTSYRKFPQGYHTWEIK